jgi:hypothetical protein
MSIYVRDVTLYNYRAEGQRRPSEVMVYHSAVEVVLVEVAGEAIEIISI